MKLLTKTLKKQIPAIYVTESMFSSVACNVMGGGIKL